MNSKRGYSEHEFGGQLRAFRFGSNQTIIFCELRKIDVADYTALYDGLKDGKIDAAFTRDLLYSALMDGARKTKTPVDFELEDIGDWIDENPDVVAAIFESAAEGNGPNLNRQQKRAAEKLNA